MARRTELVRIQRVVVCVGVCVCVQDSEGLDRTELESIKRVFERLDRKNDGKIDRDEIAQQFDILGKLN